MSNLSTAIVEEIRQQVIDGCLRPGDKLSSESALEKQFAVSRTVVREAISRLQAAGLVETYKGKGTYVLTRPGSQSFTADPQDIQSHKDRLDLLDFRTGVEVEAAALASQRRSPAQLRAIGLALATFVEARERPAAAMDADFDFHRSIAIATNNRFYLDLLSSLGATMIAMPQTRLMQVDQSAEDRHFDRVIGEHRTIHEAIGRQDLQGSAAAMRVHLVNTRARLTPFRSDGA